MRQTKFRGRHILTNEWVYGTGVFLVGDDYAAIPDTINVTPESYDMKMCKVHPNTVGQLVCKASGDGREIYTGDVVIVPDTETETVDTGVGVGVPVARMDIGVACSVHLHPHGVLLRSVETFSTDHFYPGSYIPVSQLDLYNEDADTIDVEWIGTIHDQPKITGNVYDPS